MKLRFVSDGTLNGTDVLTPDGQPFGPVASFRIDMDWDRSTAPGATVRLSPAAEIVTEVVAESQLECVYQGRRYAMSDIGPADRSDQDAD